MEKITYSDFVEKFAANQSRFEELLQTIIRDAYGGVYMDFMTGFINMPDDKSRSLICREYKGHPVEWHYYGEQHPHSKSIAYGTKGTYPKSNAPTEDKLFLFAEEEISGFKDNGAWEKGQSCAYDSTLMPVVFVETFVRALFEALDMPFENDTKHNCAQLVQTYVFTVTDYYEGATNYKAARLSLKDLYQTI